MNEKKKNKENIAIKVEGLSKTFKVPHEKHTSLKSTALNIFQKKSYTEYEALKDVSFEVKRGEFFGIIGQNGSGKSTLLKILAGIYVPESGKVLVNGKLSPFLELGVGFNPELSGRENLFLGGSILGLSRQEVAAKYDAIIKFSELEEFIDMKLKNYSSGMQVRLAFSLAINAYSEILLMDEVLAVGDDNFQRKCLKEFDKYKKEGKTVVLVSHDVGTIKKYCDRVLWLNNAKEELIGEANVVSEKYLKYMMDKGGKEREVEGKSNKSKQKPHVTTVEFMKNGKTEEFFAPGDDLTVRVHFKNNDMKRVLNFGISIFSKNEHYILGVNTSGDKIDTGKYKEKGFFEVLYKNIPLREGLFYVKIGMWGENINDLYDFHDSPNYFSVIPKDKKQGEVEMNYEWK